MIKRDYTEYLATYGHVYGDMSDPVKRAETVAMLRRHDALTAASASRELWKQATRMSDTRLCEEIRTYVYLTTDPHAIQQRGRDGQPWDVDVWYLRMYRREAARRVSGTAVRVERTGERKPRRRPTRAMREALALAVGRPVDAPAVGDPGPEALARLLRF